MTLDTILLLFIIHCIRGVRQIGYRSELHVDSTIDFSSESIGEIKSDVPGLSFSWVNSASPSLTSSPSKDIGIAKQLQISFDKLPLSPNINITGTSRLNVNKPEFKCHINRANGALLPSIANFKVGFNATLTGNVNITSQVGGNVSYAKDWFDKDIGTIKIMAGVVPLVFVAHIKVSSAISGTAAGSFSHEQNFSVLASGGVEYLRGSGWNNNKNLTPTVSASENNVEAEFGVQVQPVSVELSFKLYGIAGPYLKINGEVDANGKHKVINSEEGIEAVIEALVNGEIGLNASTGEMFEKFFEKSWTPFSLQFEIIRKEIFRKFFPYTNKASITVGDNGNSPDDIFEVKVDGILLGKTDKGGTGSFRITSLKPGTHTLTITCLEDEDYPGTLGINLENGYTFSNGSSTLSDYIDLNSTKEYKITVPTQSANSIQKYTMNLELPKNKIIEYSKYKN